MYIQIKPELEQFIQAQLASGRFASADDVINEAFKLLQEREQRLEELRQKIAIGTEQISKGQVTDDEVVFTKLKEHTFAELGTKRTFDPQQWEADMKLLAQGAEQIPVLPPEAFTRESIYGNHD